jgi:uncharacterized protein YceK
MNRIAIALAMLSSTSLLSGCASVPLPKIGDREPPVLERKMVRDKQEPQELIAADGTRCVVSSDRFARVHAGDRVWCVWGRSHTTAAAGMRGS